VYETEVVSGYVGKLTDTPSLISLAESFQTKDEKVCIVPKLPSSTMIGALAEIAD